MLIWANLWKNYFTGFTNLKEIKSFVYKSRCLSCILCSLPINVKIFSIKFNCLWDFNSTVTNLNWNYIKTKIRNIFFNQTQTKSSYSSAHLLLLKLVNDFYWIIRFICWRKEKRGKKAKMLKPNPKKMLMFAKMSLAKGG